QIARHDPRDAGAGEPPGEPGRLVATAGAERGPGELDDAGRVAVGLGVTQEVDGHAVPAYTWQHGRSYASFRPCPRPRPRPSLRRRCTSARTSAGATSAYRTRMSIATGTARRAQTRPPARATATPTPPGAPPP